MFRLTDKQLHIIMGGLCGATVLLLCFFVLFYKPVTERVDGITELSDFSEGWVAVYTPADDAQLQAFRQTDEADAVPEGKIRQVVNLPGTFSIKKGNTLTLTHKVPDIALDTCYLVMKTKGEQVLVSVDGQGIYESGNMEGYLPATHVIPLNVKYRNGMITMELTSVERDTITLEGVYEGDCSKVLAACWKENGSYVVVGGILIIGSICFVLVWLLVRNKIRSKRPLLYCAIEMAITGILFLLESSLVKLWISWTYGIYFMEVACLILMSIVHLLVIRSFTFKKKMLSLTDIGILTLSIYYISVMVLQGFHLIHMDTIRVLSLGVLSLIILIYTIFLGVDVFAYKRKEEKPVFCANGILVIAAIGQLLCVVSRGQNASSLVYMIAGSMLYYGILIIVSLLMAVRVENMANAHNEGIVCSREQVIEELNPNLLFASFHTLQNLIKNGSTNCAKMLYYISVYFRDNLKAMKEPFEMIPFEHELEHMLAYLTLQKTRNVHLDFSVECKVRNFEVPRRSLEPMIENAVMYGIAGKENQGNVVIRTYEREEGYAIQIIDDGIGFDTKHFQKNNATSLKVILAQLECTCHAQTEVVSRPGKGTVITVILPIPDDEIEEE